MKIEPDLVRRLLDRCSELQALTLVRELGRGGMGAVYLLNHGSLAPVALKIMLHTEGADETARVRFVREMNINSQLQHPNVIQVLQGGECDGNLYYTMEFCAGGSVASLMGLRGGRLPLAEATRITLQVLEGLAYAHHAPIVGMELADGSLGEGIGVVHRDLKPANIFLTIADTTGSARVADLGLAKAMELSGLTAFTPEGMIAGTPAFQPRQQVMDFKHVGPEVDVWAAAASLYNMLTGWPPRNFTPSRDPFLTVLQTSPVPILERDTSVPAEVAAFLDCALDDTKDELRFQSALDLSKALKSALARSGSS